jgi:hypothetical protein
MQRTSVTAYVCAFVCAGSVFGGPTYKNGLVVDETWTALDSPYYINGDITVAGLSIQPGVEVQFLGAYTFEVDGILKAQGTADQPISFLRATTNPGVGWKGIFFNEGAPGSFLSNCRIEGATSSGIRMKNSTPTLTNCVIINNSSTGSGGGVDASAQNGNLILDHCTLANNSSSTSGGGINAVLAQGTLTLNFCTIINNKVTKGTYGGGGVLADGKAVILQCLVASNTAGPNVYPGGGGLSLMNGSVTMKNCDITANYSKPYAGGVSIYNGSLNMWNCKFATNRSDGAGSAIEVHGQPYSTASGVNCSFIGNTPEAIWGGDNCTLKNSIVYFNNSNGAQFLGTPKTTYSDIQGGNTANGNKNSNPILDPLTLELITGSPCIDAGDPAPQYNDVAFPPSKGTARNDMGVYGGPGAASGIGPNTGDQDVDGIPDSWMVKYFGHPTGLASDHSLAQDDADNDALTNAQEFSHGTDPTKSDTDGDGYNDLTEIEVGSDPLDSKSVPPPSLAISVQQVKLEFIAGLGETSIVQASSDLQNWLPIEQVIGVGDREFRIYGVTNNMRYFRLVRP